VVEELPLFPLGTVLFPGLLLPLHIFEERYRQLVRDLQDVGDREPQRFGVIAIRQGRETGVDGVRALYEVGCAAQIRRVEAYDDGRYDLVTVGTSRFRLHELQHRRPYLSGLVEWLPEREGDPDTARLLCATARRLFDRYLRALATAQGSTVDPPDLPNDPRLLSYLVAATLITEIAGKQRLLAEPTAVARLRAELEIVGHETSMLRTLSAAPAPELIRGPISLN
jgi:uncharacterized protein